MTRSRLLFALLSLVLVAFPLAAARPVWIVPSAPTSITPVTVFVTLTCHAGDPSVTVAGSVIQLSWPGEGCATLPFPGSVPPPMEYSVALPSLLAPGQYRVDVIYPGQSEVDLGTTFIVRDGAPPFVIHPFVLPATVNVSRNVRLAPASAVCAKGCTIRVGGVLVEEKSVNSDDSISFVAPPHEPGLVDVSVQEGQVVRHSPAALYYFDLNDPPDPSVFERILFPVLFSAPGAGGSQWVTDAVISNPRKWAVWNYNSILPYVCLGYPCGEQLGPGSAERFRGYGYPNGVSLVAPREEAGDLAFSLRARDVSRDAEGLGTQLPVVREGGMFRGEMTLLNVPRDPRYRVKLRVYALDPSLSGVAPAVTVIGAPGIAISALMTSTCQAFDCSFSPYSANFDFPPGATGELTDLYVELEPGYLGWALVTVTNNSTQQVTIVTPDGKGGRPTP